MKKPILTIIGPNKSLCTPLQRKHAEMAGQLAVELGYRVMTGGEKGVMESAFIGAKKAANYQSGDTIAISPKESAVGDDCLADIVIYTGLGHARNYIMAHGQIILAIGGGTGTLSEMAMAWSKCRPILAFAGSGWAGKLAGKRLDGRRKDRVVLVRGRKDLAAKLQQFSGRLSRSPVR
jgi:uncharacterized protein (TIGR00725 family)